MRINLYIIVFFTALLFSVFRSSNTLSHEDIIISPQDSLTYFFDLSNQDSIAKDIRFYATESAMKIVLAQKNDSLRNINLFKIANRYWNLGDYQNHFKIIQQLLSKAEKESNIPNKAKCYLYLYEHFDRYYVLDSALYYLALSERLYTKLGNREKLAAILIEKADFYIKQNNYFACEKNLYTAAAIQEISNINKFRCNLKLANLHVRYGENKIAQKYFNHAAALMKFNNSDKYWCRAVYYDELGFFYLNTKRYFKAEKVLTKALKVPYIRNNYPEIYTSIISNLSLSQIEQHKLYNPEKIYEAIRIQDSSNLKIGKLASKMILAKFYLDRRDTVRAITEAKSAYASALQYQSTPNILYIVRELIKIDHSNACLNTNKYLKIFDSIQVVEQRNRNKFARIEYETDELEKQIEQVESEKASLSQLGIILLFVLLTTAVFWWQHVRTKELGFIREKSAQNNQIFELLNNDHQKIQQGKNIEKKRIARELHDGVMGRLASIRLNLFALKKDTSSATIEKCISHIDSIQEIEKEIRAIAYDLGSDIMSDEVSFISIIKSLFASIEEHSDIHLHCDSSRDIPWNAISNNSKMQVYRIIQESLHNIEKHARAQNAFILICATEKHIEFIIRDDGVGFCKKKIKKGFGLANIYGRARTIKAQVKIDSILNSGTTIILTVPFENNTPKTNEDDHTNTYD